MIKAIGEFAQSDDVKQVIRHEAAEQALALAREVLGVSGSKALPQPRTIDVTPLATDATTPATLVAPAPVPVAPTPPPPSPVVIPPIVPSAAPAVDESHWNYLFDKPQRPNA